MATRQTILLLVGIGLTVTPRLAAEGFVAKPTLEVYVGNDSWLGPDKTYKATQTFHIFNTDSSTYSSLKGKPAREVGYSVYDVTELKAQFGEYFYDVNLSVAGNYQTWKDDFKIYGVKEAYEGQVTSAVTWNTAPGLKPTALGAAIEFQTSQLTDLVTVTGLKTDKTIYLQNSSALADFLNDDTNGKIVLMLAPLSNGKETVIYSLPIQWDAGVQIHGYLEGDPHRAQKPIPANRLGDVYYATDLRWTGAQGAATHTVYLSTNFADVNEGRASALVAQGLTEAVLAPAQPLTFGATYYWRVDEVNPALNPSVYPGAVWSFTVEPVAYKVAGVTATASSAEATADPQNAANGSGLDANDCHGVDYTTMWLSAKSATGMTWIEFALGRTYKLHQMWVWNHNSEFESLLGLGIKDAVIEYSTNGTDWLELGDYQLAQATGKADYTHNTTIELSGILASHVRISAKSAWGISGQCGLSEVRFLYIPVWARNPDPAVDATGVSLNPTLSWRPGRDAVSHQVYFGTDNAAVTNGTGSAIATSTSSYTPGALSLGTTYYWKVNEVSPTGTPSVWTSDVWPFSTTPFLAVDDMESYNDQAGTAVFDMWSDGYGAPSTNACLVGHAAADNGTFCEKTIVHGGAQSMPFYYNNSASVTTAEATCTFSTSRDWTASGIKTLVIYFRGAATNAAAQLYVKINGTKIDYMGNSADLLATTWKQWNVDVTTVANLKAVKTLTLGVSGSAAGLLYFDDIRLYKTAP